jgi:hypothetical protein
MVGTVNEEYDPITNTWKPARDLFEGVSTDGYNGVWKGWKYGSLGLFAVFVLILADAARTLRRISKQL